jgi:hypothetical protein
MVMFINLGWDWLFSSVLGEYLARKFSELIFWSELKIKTVNEICCIGSGSVTSSLWGLSEMALEAALQCAFLFVSVIHLKDFRHFRKGAFNDYKLKLIVCNLQFMIY